VRRTAVPELLDTDSGTPEEVAASLIDLQWVNRNFGGHTTTLALLRSALRHLRNPKRVSYLDVAGASSDGLAFAQQQLTDVMIRLTVLDRSPRHLQTENGIAICGDALVLPFRDSSFDLVGCSLFVHHLEPEELLQFAREALRVARHAVLINDLVRSRIHYLAAAAGKVWYRSPLTRHDAPVSVRRAYTPRELCEILDRSGASRIEISRHYFYRMGVIAWR
jgi:ubiquinone/menaquinone biosynthesis C-methylase UbiE